MPPGFRDRNRAAGAKCGYLIKEIAVFGVDGQKKGKRGERGILMKKARWFKAE
jgi:hypothetical protein